MDKLRRVLSGNDDEEQGIVTEVAGSDSTCSSLSWGTRIRGFVICFGIGLVLSVIGTIFAFTANVVAFALIFTLGNVMSLSSTLFLMGPLNQLKRMFAPTRLIATIVVVVMMILTLLAGCLGWGGVVALIFCLLQYVAMIWYSISYIPFARDAVIKCFQGCLG